MSEATPIRDLFGTYEGRVDLASGRLSLPSDFESLKFTKVWVGIEPWGRYLHLRLPATLEPLQDGVFKKANGAESPEKLSWLAFYLGEFWPTQVDNSFRLVIPKKAREVLKGDPEVVIVGIGHELQIWPRGEWERFREQARQIIRDTYEKYATEIYRCAPAEEAQAMSGPVG